MSFNDLPDHIVIQILTQLDDVSQFRAISVFKRWAEIFASSSQLIDRFEFRTHNDAWKLDDYPDIPIKNVYIDNFSIHTHSDKDRKCILDLLRKYEKSIKNISIDKSEFLPDEFGEILKLKNLDDLCFSDVVVQTMGFYQQNCHLTTPTIKSLEIRHEKISSVNRMLNLFNSCVSIEKLSVQCDSFEGTSAYEADLKRNILLNFIKSLPNLKYLNFRNVEGYKDIENILTPSFPAKLEKLKISRLTFEFQYDQYNMVHFFRNQKDTMKELIIYEGYDMNFLMNRSEILFVIFNQMKLKNFKFGNIEMIVNYERQPASFIPILKKPEY